MPQNIHIYSLVITSPLFIGIFLVGIVKKYNSLRKTKSETLLSENAAVKVLMRHESQFLSWCITKNGWEHMSISVKFQKQPINCTLEDGYIHMLLIKNAYLCCSIFLILSEARNIKHFFLSKYYLSSSCPYLERSVTTFLIHYQKGLAESVRLF